MNYETKFKEDLINRFREKKISESSIKLYVRNLEKLNDDMPLKNLKFLNKSVEIIEKLKNYKPNTFRGYLISICSALNLDKNKKTSKIYNEYYKVLMNTNKELKEIEKEQEKTPTQQENWINWEDVEKKHKELSEEVEKIKNSKEINQHKYNKLLEFILLSLYFYIAPKRNQDWALMKIIYKYEPDLTTSFNYYDYTNNIFIFNKYKTSKTNGEITEKIPDELKKVIDIYFKFHPLLKHKHINKLTDVFFLVYYNGTPFTSINSITRILNKIFNKKIGSSMLRHIYLSSKYSNTVLEMKEDAKQMGHSVDTQINNYIKK